MILARGTRWCPRRLAAPHGAHWLLLPPPSTIRPCSLPKGALETPLPPSPLPPSRALLTCPHGATCERDTRQRGGDGEAGGGNTASCPSARGDWLSLRDRRGHRARELSIKSGQGWPRSWGGSPLCVFSPRAWRGGARGGESPGGAAWGEGCGAPPNPSLRARQPGVHSGN